MFWGKEILVAFSLILLLTPNMCLFFFPTPATNSLTTIGCLPIQFNSDTSNWRKHRSPQVKGPVPQDCSHFRYHSQVPGTTHTFNQLTINLRVFVTPPPKVQLSPHQLAELMETLSWCLPSYYKGYDLGTGKWEKCIGQGHSRAVEDTELPCLLHVCHSLNISVCSPTHHCSRTFIELSL